jgi:methionyl aminopeptidase
VVELRTSAEIEAMRPAGRFVADVVVSLAEAAEVGMNLLDLDELAHQLIRERGADSCYIDYHPSFGVTVRQGALHLCERRGAARATA